MNENIGTRQRLDARMRRFLLALFALGVLGAGAEDLKDEGDHWEVISPPEAHHDVLQGIEGAGLATERAEVTRIPQNTVKVEGKQAAAVLRMIEALEDQDDTQNVYANFDIDDAELERLTA